MGLGEARLYFMPPGWEMIFEAHPSALTWDGSPVQMLRPQRLPLWPDVLTQLEDFRQWLQRGGFKPEPQAPEKLHRGDMYVNAYGEGGDLCEVRLTIILFPAFRRAPPMTPERIGPIKGNGIHCPCQTAGVGAPPARGRALSAVWGALAD
jgi:hypothetical protein